MATLQSSLETMRSHRHCLALRWIKLERDVRDASASPIASLHPDLPGLPAQHRLLAGDAPVIAGERAALAQRAMTGDDKGHRIPADRPADGARGLRIPDVAGDVRIGCRASHRNF